MNEKVYVVKNYYRHSSYNRVIDNWHSDFDTQPPKSTIYSLVKKFEDTESVGDAPRSGRPRTLMTDANSDIIAAAYVHSPTKSQRRASLYQEALVVLWKTQHSMKPYRPRIIHALNKDESDPHLQFCETFLSCAEKDPNILDKIIWGDEVSFKLNDKVNRHNCVYWSDSNPHVTMEHELNLPGLTV